MGSGGENYLTMEGDFYTAIRIPEPGKSFRAKRMVSEERSSIEDVIRMERNCRKKLHQYDQGLIGSEEALSTLVEYDQFITPDRPPHIHLLRRTLEAAPWKECPCEICKRDGIDVIIFRGNNRNRRRGFHNTYVFYRLLQKVLAGEAVSLKRKPDQLNLFGEPREPSHAV